MSAAKYPSLTVTLETKIRQGAYRDKIPTTRKLAAEFAVSRQTVTNALRPLIDKGMLIAAGRRGVRISHRHQAHGMIGIVAVGDSAVLTNTPIMSRLQQQINNDGFESVLLSISSLNTYKNICSLLSDNFTGLIFTYSSLTMEIAEYLESKKIPFISCNRLPVYSHLNFVEHDWAGAIRRISEEFAQKGCLKQSLFFQGRLEGYGHLVREQWKNIKNGLNLLLLKIDELELDYRETPSACFFKYLKALHETEQYPQLLIMWSGITDEIVEMACHGQYKLPEQCIITGPLKTGKPPPEQILTFSEGDYHNLLLAAYEGLRELILAPSDKFIHRFVDFPVVWNIKKNEDMADLNL